MTDRGPLAHCPGMRNPLRIVAAFVAVLALVWSPVAASAATDLPAGMRPVPGPVITRFDPPDVTWGTGHRGVDLEGSPGETVAAAADGTVTNAAVLAGRGVVVVDHGAVRTTYEPVAATVVAGDVVSRGQPIGRLQSGHASCPGRSCLHWGLLEGDTYRDPLLLLSATIRLLPVSATPELRTTAVSGSLTSSAGGLVRPATGPVTSTYGMRRHPITGVWKLHDGTDLSAPCGSPIRAAAAGTVVSITYTSAYGNRLIIDNGRGASGHLVTGYNHAQGYAVGVGDRVAAGQVIGAVGSTGLTTGCHLHFQVWIDGGLVDPLTVLP
jgi:murein DD-endopeptidase MepM/ murein hydrolase activator NlpD